MIIKNIHSMKWKNVEHTLVGLVADTDMGDNKYFMAYYIEASPFWDYLKEFPVKNIPENVGYDEVHERRNRVMVGPYFK